MNFEIVVHKRKEKPKSVDYRELFLTSVSLEDLFEYNSILADVVASAFPQKKYLISPTLTRMEAQTCFFDRLCKYLALTRLIDNAKQNIRIENLDRISLEALNKYVQRQGYSYRCNRFTLVMQRLLHSSPRFLFKLFLLTIYELILLTLSKILLEKPVDDYEYGFLSFFDYRSKDSKGRYQDPYFQPLMGYLRLRGRKFLVIVNLLQTKRWLKTFRTLFSIRRMGQYTKVITVERLLSVRDILNVARLSIKSSILFRNPIRYKGQDISDLLKLSLREDITDRSNWFFAYKNYYLSKRLSEMSALKRIFYPFENHPWEKMLVLQRNENGRRPKLIAFQHSSFSFKSLNHFPAKQERDLPIYPDKILTVGQIPKEILEKHGHYPEGTLQEGCALRHPYLFSNHKTSRRTRSKKVAFAFSSDARTYAPILKNLKKIFGKENVLVYLKTHPLVDETKIFSLPLPINFVKAQDIPWENLFREIDFLLYHDNSLGIEALQYGVDSFYFDMVGEVYNCDRLFNYQNGHKIVARSVEEFSKFIYQYYANKNPVENDEEDKRRYLHNYFSPITIEKMERFLS